MAGLILVIAPLAFARPFTITCPYDGAAMWFTRQVGFGKSAVCWYSHTAYNGGKHEAYVLCGD